MRPADAIARTSPHSGGGRGATVWAVRYARLALGAAFLSAVASRVGLWDGTVNWDHFARFIGYTAEVNAFLPRALAPVLACVATAAELSLGVALICGFATRWAAWGSAVLLALFGAAMALSFGVKSPMDYSVFAASAAALLIAVHDHSPAPTQPN